MNKRVTGLGGIFFKTSNPKEMRSWYHRHLGVGQHEWGEQFQWRELDNPEKVAYSVWSPFKSDSDYFSPSESEFMVNFRVENLRELIEALKQEGVTVVGEIQEEPYGKFAWILDPEGRKIELWEPDDSPQD